MPWQPFLLRAQPLESLPLNDLSAFSESNDSWTIAGDVSGLWDSDDLNVEPGSGIMVHELSSDGASRLATAWEHGDLILELEYLIAQGSESGIFLQGRYEVQIADSWGISRPRFSDSGGIGARTKTGGSSAARGMDGHAPRANASKAPGLWQHLRIVFEAPRFSDDGRKTTNARVVEVVLNGVTVQQSVQLGGPTVGASIGDERPTGPLVFEGAGDVAFRNIRYRHYETAEPITLSNVRYTLYRGEFASLAEMRETPPAATGAAFGYVWNLFGQTADRIGVDWRGTIHIPRAGEYLFTTRFNWIDEIPYEEDAVAGLGQFLIGGDVVIDHVGSDSTASGRLRLNEGDHTFELSYFKNRHLWRPIVFLRVEGPGQAPQFLNAHRTLPEPESSYPPIPLEAAREPYVLRSFAEYDSTKVTNVVSVGDPRGVHYALDLDSGGLLAVWKGAFVDVGSMWTARGELQYARPLGQMIELTNGPTAARLVDPEAPWPEIADRDGFVFRGYRLDAEGRPCFRFARADGLQLRETFTPAEDGRMLARRLAFSVDRPTDDLTIRAAEGATVREQRPGVFVVDGKYYVYVGSNASALVRGQGRRFELLLPVQFSSDGEALLDYSIVW